MWTARRDGRTGLCNSNCVTSATASGMDSGDKPRNDGGEVASTRAGLIEDGLPVPKPQTIVTEVDV